MNSDRIKAFVQLSRPINVLITFVSIPVACWIAGGELNDWLMFLLSAITGALVTAGANAINDSFDIEIDKINKPERPLPRGALSQRDARNMWLVTSVVAIVINIFINLIALIIVVISIVLLYFYSAKLKRTIIIGNILVGLMTGMAFIYGGVVIGKIDYVIMPALFAFLSNFARELVKDVEDVEGDKKENALTLPVRFGIKSTLIVATLILLLLFASTIYAIIENIYNEMFFYIVALADVIIIVSIFMMWSSATPVQMSRVSNCLKLVMVIGLFSIILGSI